MAGRLHWYTSASAFLVAAGPSLLRDEAENTLLLGVGSDPRWAGTPLPAGHRLATLDRDPVRGALTLSPVLLALGRMPATAATDLAVALAEQGTIFPVLMACPPESDAFLETWCARGGWRAVPEQSQGVYVADRAIDPSRPAAGELIVAGGELRDLACEWAGAFLRESAVPGQSAETLIDGLLQRRRLLFWHDREPVCMGAGVAQTPGGTRIGHVFTPPALRGKGYASSWIAAATRHFLGERERCFLYTDLDNPTSNAIYVRAGYRQIGRAMTYRLEKVD